MPEPTPPAEALLIRSARKTLGISAVTAARRMADLLGKDAAITGPYWRDVERGVTRSRGVPTRLHASARTLAGMCLITEVKPEDLRDLPAEDAEHAALLEDAARILGGMITRRDRPGRDLARDVSRLPPRAQDVIRGMIDVLARDPDNGTDSGRRVAEYVTGT